MRAHATSFLALVACLISEYIWTEASFAGFLRRLARFSRLILFDQRGTGLSDGVTVDKLPTLEQRMGDVKAVMDHAGSERAALCGVWERPAYWRISRRRSRRKLWD